MRVVKVQHLYGCTLKVTLAYEPPRLLRWFIPDEVECWIGDVTIWHEEDSWRTANPNMSLFLSEVWHKWQHEMKLGGKEKAPSCDGNTAPSTSQAPSISLSRFSRQGIDP